MCLNKDEYNTYSVAAFFNFIKKYFSQKYLGQQYFGSFHYFKKEPQFKMEPLAWQNEMTQLIMVLVVLFLVWILKDKIRTIIINPNETTLELQTTDDTSSFRPRLKGLENQVQAIQSEIQSIKIEIGETKRPQVELEENTLNIQPNNESEGLMWRPL